jgi:hypothetical protein
MVIINYFHFVLNDHISRFPLYFQLLPPPAGGEVPIAIGREGGINKKNGNFIHDCRYSY